MRRGIRVLEVKDNNGRHERNMTPLDG